MKAGTILLIATLGSLFLVIVVGSGTLPQFILLGGLLAAAVGAYALAVGSAGRFRVRSRRVGALVLGTGLLFAMVGGGVNAAVNPPEPTQLASNVAPKTDEKEAKEKATPTPTPTPVVTEEEVRESLAIPFTSRTVDDPNMDVGTSGITTTGVDGKKTIIYVVTYIDGAETERSVLREEVNVQPIAQITSVGTKQPYVAPPPPAPKSNGCHPSYSGVCVPQASDVDCAGGSGNGPEYVSGPLRVVGPDVYDLDRDGDGIACD
ncbi:hypothetical protein IWX78_001431 [Mycetocola sp. CAN_C7]|uniref:G5 domain-containing protein n=1 Tax=Mycetocola sp. CAN_C7 TaxID=2787724 RepID=UPI001A33F759